MRLTRWMVLPALVALAHCGQSSRTQNAPSSTEHPQGPDAGDGDAPDANTPDADTSETGVPEAGAGPTLVHIGSLAFTASMFDLDFAFGDGSVLLADFAGKVHAVDPATRTETATGSTGAYTAILANASEIAFAGGLVAVCYYEGGGYMLPYSAQAGFGTASKVDAFATCQSFAAIPGGSLLAVTLTDLSDTVATELGVFDGAQGFEKTQSIPLGSSERIGASATTIASPYGTSALVYDQVFLTNLATSTVTGPISVKTPDGIYSSSVAFALSHDGKSVYFADGEDVSVIDVTTASVTGTVRGPWSHWTKGRFDLSADGNFIVAAGTATSGQPYGVLAVNIADGQASNYVELPAGFQPYVTKVAPDGTILVLGNTPAAALNEPGVDSLEFFTLE
jgi:YVTN family beta-propeller protein